jgi:hypothetical protein
MNINGVTKVVTDGPTTTVYIGQGVQSNSAGNLTPVPPGCGLRAAPDGAAAHKAAVQDMRATGANLPMAITRQVRNRRG